MNKVFIYMQLDTMKVDTEILPIDSNSSLYLKYLGQNLDTPVWMYTLPTLHTIININFYKNRRVGHIFVFDTITHPSNIASYLKNLKYTFYTLPNCCTFMVASCNLR